MTARAVPAGEGVVASYRIGDCHRAGCRGHSHRTDHSYCDLCRLELIAIARVRGDAPSPAATSSPTTAMPCPACYASFGDDITNCAECGGTGIAHHSNSPPDGEPCSRCDSRPTAMPGREELGRVAYEGAMLGSWEYQKPAEREAWCRAAEAVRNAITGVNDGR